MFEPRAPKVRERWVHMLLSFPTINLIAQGSRKGTRVHSYHKRVVHTYSLVAPSHRQSIGKLNKI
jgi:hypothetical protein